MNEKKKLNLSPENITKKPMSPEEAAESMGRFYNLMGDCLINLVSIHETISKNIEAMAVDTTDIAFYMKKIALEKGAVSEMEIEEHEKETEEPDGD